MNRIYARIKHDILNLKEINQVVFNMIFYTLGVRTNILIDKVKEIINKHLNIEKSEITVIEDSTEINNSGIYIIADRIDKKLQILKSIKLDRNNYIHIYLITGTTYLQLRNIKPYNMEIQLNLEEYKRSREDYIFRIRELNNIDINNKIIYIIRNIYNNKRINTEEKRERIDNIIEKIVETNIRV